MIICGLKLSHDGGVAVVDDGYLALSVEMEKLDNRPRYSRLDSTRTVNDVLTAYGYTARSVDRWVIDGWHDNHLIHLAPDGTLIDMSLADSPASLPRGAGRVSLGPYRTDFDLLREPVTATLGDRPYISYSHYAGHVAGGYASSPFARTGQPSYVLCWDGAMTPFLYYVDGSLGTIREVAPFSLPIGMAYFQLPQSQPPFDVPIAFPKTLGLSGKVMAYAALGSVRDDTVDALDGMYDSTVAAICGAGPGDAFRQDERTRRLILDRFCAEAARRLDPAEAANNIASMQAFFGRRLQFELRSAIARDGARSRALCMVGGCALNIKWNSEIRRMECLDQVWVPPFANDSGSALGAACCELIQSKTALEWNVYAGPQLRPSSPIPGWSARDCSIDDLAHRLATVNEPLAFLQGRAEIGPRALGHRSILAAATSASMKDDSTA